VYNFSFLKRCISKTEKVRGWFVEAAFSLFESALGRPRAERVAPESRNRSKSLGWVGKAKRENALRQFPLEVSTGRICTSNIVCVGYFIQ
jgi:hypothetical protein